MVTGKIEHKATTEPYEVKIYIAGEYEKAKDLCREFCNEVPLCVTVTPTEYVYTGGAESGVIVGLIQYPRFPSSTSEIFDKADKLGKRLCEGLHQASYTISTPTTTFYFETELKTSEKQ